MAGKITALVLQKKNKERVNVYIDGEFAFGLALMEAAKLKKGQLLSDEDITRLKALDEIEVAKAKALDYLAYRPRSIEETRRKLREKDLSEEAVEAALESLINAGLLDDQEFARFWVDNRERFKPRSRRALRYELKRKGLSDADIQPALEGVDELNAAYRAAEARVRRYRNADEKTFRKKLGGYLQRRGFHYGIVREVLDDLWEAQHAEQEDDV